MNLFTEFDLAIPFYVSNESPIHKIVINDVTADDNNNTTITNSTITSDSDYNEDETKFSDYNDDDDNDDDKVIISTTTKKQSLFAKIKSWYHPTYIKSIDEPADKEPRLRYCNGRLTKRKFFCLNLAILCLFFTLIFTPLTYFVIIPAFVRYKISSVNLNDISIDYMDIVDWRSNGLSFDWEAHLSKQFFLPLNAKLDPINLTVHDQDNNNLLIISVPEMNVNIGEPIDLKFKGDITFEDNSALSSLLEKISAPGGINATNMVASTGISVSMFGINWYKNLEISKSIPLPKLDSNLMNLWSNMPPFIMSADKTKPETESVNVGGVNSTIEKPLVIDGIEYWQILPGFPPINFKALDVKLIDNGPIISVSLLMQNPTVLSIPIPDTSIAIELEHSYFATTSIQGFTLTRGLNTLNLNLSMTFDPNRIVTSDQIGNSVSKAFGKILGVDPNNEGLSLNVIGPIKMTGIDSITEITQHLSLILPINEIVNRTNLKLLSNLLNVSGVESILHTVNFNVDVQNDRIFVPIEIKMPSFLPLPPRFDFPYTTSLGLFKNDQNTLDIILDGISMTNDDNLLIKTTAQIIPNNTLLAADALGKIVNPALNSQISSADVKNFNILDNSNKTFSWADQLLGNLTLTIPIPGFNLTSIVNMLTQNGTNIPAQIINLALNQRTDISGFDINGNVTIQYPPQLPIIAINTGYISTTVDIDSSLLLTANLPNGISYTTDQPSTSIVASALLDKNNIELPLKIADLVNGVLSENDLPMPILGVSNVILGTSQQVNFVTFSKVIVPINLSTLKPALKTAIETMTNSIQEQKGLLKLNGIDLDIQTSTSISLKMQSTLNNPTNITANIGQISLGVILNDGKLATISVSPIQLLLGQSPLNIDLVIELATGANGMSNNVLQLFQDVTAKEGAEFKSVIGITGIVISPPITTPQGNTTAATIDQFNATKITVPSSLIPASKLQSIDISSIIKDPSNAIIDFTGVLPNDQTQLTLPTIQSVTVKTIADANLIAGAFFKYINPLPLSVRIPYLYFTLSLDDNAIVSMSIVNVELKRGEGGGTMSPSAVIKFYNSEGAQTSLNTFVDNILNKQFSQKVSLSEIYFGQAPNNSNDLISLLNLNLPIEILNVETIINKVIELSPIKLPLGIDQLLGEFAPQLTSVDISTKSNRHLSLQIGAQLTIPFDIIADVGFFATKLSLDGSSFTSVTVPGLKISGSGKNDVSLEIELGFSNDDAVIPDSIKTILDKLAGGDFISTKIGIDDFVLGVSESDTIKTLGSISLSTEIGNLASGKIDFKSQLDKILSELASSTTPIISVGNGTISLNIPNLVQMEISNMAIKVLPDQIINVDITTSITLPFSLTMNIGFAGVDVFLDDISAVELSVSASSQGKLVTINTQMKLGGDNVVDLSDKIGSITQSFFNNEEISGTLGIRSPLIGSSKDDLIKAFSQISIELSMNELLTPIFKNIPRSIDPITLLDQFGFKLESVYVASTTGPSIVVNLKASFVNNFPISMDLGFLSLSLGLDKVPLIGFNLQDLQVGSGANNGLTLTSVVSFIADFDDAQTKIADFVSNLQKNGLGSTTELITIDNIKIGATGNDVIVALTKVIIGLPSSSIINQKFAEKLLNMIGLTLNDLTIDGLINRLSIQKLNMNLLSSDNSGPMVVDGQIGLNNISFPITVDMNYLAVTLSLNSNDLTQLTMTGLKITTTNNNQILTEFKVEMLLKDSDGLEQDIATIAKTIIETNDVIPGNAFITGLLFGENENDNINLLSKVSLSLPLNPLLQPIKQTAFKLVNGLLDGTSPLSLKLEDIILGVKDPDVMSVDFASSIAGLPQQISISVPFASIDINFDGEQYITSVINGLKLENGEFKTSIDLKFTDNKTISNKLANIAADIVFRRLTNTVTQNVGITNIKFGGSADKPYSLMSKISVALDVGKFINQTAKFNNDNNLLVIDDIQAKVVPQGVVAKFTAPAIPNLPLTFNVPSLLAVVFMNNGNGVDSIANVNARPTIKKGDPKWSFQLDIFIENDPMAKALEIAVPNLLEFKSFTQGVSLGGIFLCQKDDCISRSDNDFKIFDQIIFPAPPLILWSPIQVSLTKILPINLLISFTNPSPLHMDIGNFKFALENRGDSIFEIFSQSSIIINNLLEGQGKNSIPIEAKLTLDVLQIPQIIIDLPKFDEAFDIKITVDQPDSGPISWLNDLLKNLPRTVLKNFVPIIQ
ncbi:10865_t:CDS:2, partial [Entrophospora sp. SA101]